MRLLRRQRWLFVWGLLALALQLTWAAAHVHQHPGEEAQAVAAAGILHGDGAGHGHDHAHEDEGQTHTGSDDHRHAAHPDCAACWTQSLAAALAVPAFPAIPLRRALNHQVGSSLSSAPPAFFMPRGFQARAPPAALS